jgi:TetR/AcrR family transcriptional repressor of nem operon
MLEPRKECLPESRAARTREALLDAAMICMRQKGYEATSVDDILKGTELTKGAFYFHFHSKEDFALAVIDRALKQNWPRFEAALRTSGEDPYLPLRELFRVFSQSCQVGCLFGNLAAEMSAKSPAIRERLGGIFECWHGALRWLADQLKARGAVTPAIDSSQLARLFIAQIQGAVLLTKLDPKPELLERHCEQLIQLLSKTVSRREPERSPS